uniref:Tumor suppressor p53-binding protein 1 n=1 Tax=Ascaris suum TaxID=6253 RepID=F1KRF2_ASCSU
MSEFIGEEGSEANGAFHKSPSRAGGCGGSETAVNDIMQVLRKGVFGKSVSYLQTPNHSGDDPGKDSGPSGLATEGAPESVKVSEQEARCESDSAEQDQKRSSVEKDAAIGGEGCSEEKDEASVEEPGANKVEDKAKNFDEDMGAGSDAVASVNDTGTEEGTEAQDEELQKADKECEIASDVAPTTDISLPDSQTSSEQDSGSGEKSGQKAEEKQTVLREKDDVGEHEGNEDGDTSRTEKVRVDPKEDVFSTSSALSPEKESKSGEKDSQETEKELKVLTESDNMASSNGIEGSDIPRTEKSCEDQEIRVQEAERPGLDNEGMVSKNTDEVEQPELDNKDKRSKNTGDEASSADEQGEHNKDLEGTSVRRSTRRSAKEAVDEQTNDLDDEEKKAAEERRRSLRAPKQISYSGTGLKSGIAAKAEKSVKGDGKKVDKKKTPPALEDTPTTKLSESSTHRTRRLPKEKGSPVAGSMSTPKRSQHVKTGSSKKTSSSEGMSRRKTSGPSKGSGSDDDPFSFESNFDNHPQPLRNIQMERQSFGNIKFTKASTIPNTSSNRYEKTEQTASERRPNLSDFMPQLKHNVVHKSLSELSAIRRTSRKSRKAKSASEGLFADVADSDDGEEAMEEDMQLEGLAQVDGENVASGASGTARTPKYRRRKIARKANTASPTLPSRKRRMKEETAGVPVKKTKAQLPSLSADEQFAVDHRVNEHAPYDIGARVYALWGREYYAAQVSAERDSSGRYGLSFVEDGQVRTLVITGIIPLTALTEGKQCGTTTSRDGDEVMECVEIVKAPSSVDKQQWLEAIFVVRSIEHGYEYSVPWEKLMLRANQASELLTAKVNTACDVIADNIDSTEARRSRAARHMHAPEDATPARLSRSPKKPKDDGDIFRGISVVVTSAMRKNKDEEQAFSKREVRQMIESHGGIVSDDFTKIPAGEKVLLIADTHYRTHKYLSALARSVPCVRHQWIRDCVEQNKLLDYNDYMLPAGVSLLTGLTVPWHANNGRLLEGKRVLLYTRNFYSESQMPNFSEIWAPLIQQMGASVVDQMPPDGVDILLTDASCPEEVLAKARSFNATIVSSEWIIQSIINGSLPDPMKHERFNYNFVDSQ